MTRPSDTQPLASLKPGDRIAEKYVVEGTLGKGGMGVVLVARHVDLDQRVAIKVLRPYALRDPLALERFLREARAVASLKSERTVRVFDLGRMPSGEAYIVMELLDGESLTDRVKARGALPVAVAVGFALDVTNALSEAHDRGIVHRDVKTSNLFVARLHDGSECVKILDFGIAKVAPADTEGRSTPKLTEPGEMLGSPHYMAPEQLRAASEAEPRTDIWGLGVVLYELLSGERPFRGDDIATIILAIANVTPPDPRSDGRAIPEGLVRVVMRCLAKDPVDRFASMGELAAALRPFASAVDAKPRDIEETVTDRSNIERTVTEPRAVVRAEPRRRGRVAIAIAVAAVVVMGSVVVLFVSRSDRAQADGAASSSASPSAVPDAIACPSANMAAFVGSNRKKTCLVTCTQGGNECTAPQTCKGWGYLMNADGSTGKSHQYCWK